jgi:hypothetical protein
MPKRSNRRRADNTMPKDQIEECQTTQCQQIKQKKDRQHNAKRSNRRRTDNSMPKDQIEEGQTTQCQQIK